MVRRRGRRIARGLDIGETYSKMGESIKAEVQGKEKWEKYTGIGTRNWTYWMRIVYPYLGFISAHPDLTEEQRQIAMKEFYRRLKEGFPAFLSSVASEAVKFSKAFAIPVVARSPKPSAGYTSYLPV